ncbi:Zinc finger A20 and AN1 domain-containing stress-associated protein 5 [Spatholobus suberectus]|nr:Zinc finger A20 and AN1 domain-containing stress-associated protein 5 [Spatholobus suberectus]
MHRTKRRRPSPTTPSTAAPTVSSSSALLESGAAMVSSSAKSIGTLTVTDCSYDYKVTEREAIARENPIIKDSKIVKNMKP